MRRKNDFSGMVGRMAAGMCGRCAGAGAGGGGVPG